jgi:hypothetical protein
MGCCSDTSGRIEEFRRHDLGGQHRGSLVCKRVSARAVVRACVRRCPNKPDGGGMACLRVEDAGGSATAAARRQQTWEKNPLGETTNTTAKRLNLGCNGSLSARAPMRWGTRWRCDVTAHGDARYRGTTRLWCVHAARMAAAPARLSGSARWPASQVTARHTEARRRQDRQRAHKVLQHTRIAKHPRLEDWAPHRRERAVLT